MEVGAANLTRNKASSTEKVNHRYVNYLMSEVSGTVLVCLPASFFVCFLDERLQFGMSCEINPICLELLHLRMLYLTVLYRSHIDYK